MPIEELWGVAECVPPEWYEYDDAGLERLVEELWKRRSRVAELVHDFKESSRAPFPNWTKSMAAVQ